SAPASRPATRSATSSRAERMHTGTSTPSARRRRTTLTLSRSGIVTSRITAAGGIRPTASSASSPPAAVATAKPSRLRARWRAGKRVGAAHRPGRANLFERGSQLVPIDAELARQGVEEIPRPAGRAEWAETSARRWATGVGPQRVERAFHLRLIEPELARQSLGERIAPGGLGRLLLGLKLGERIVDLRLGQPERVGERLPGLGAR